MARETMGRVKKDKVGMAETSDRLMGIAQRYRKHSDPNVRSLAASVARQFESDDTQGAAGEAPAAPATTGPNDPSDDEGGGAEGEEPASPILTGTVTPPFVKVVDQEARGPEYFEGFYEGLFTTGSGRA